MPDATTFVPAHLSGGVYHKIGGTYATREQAVDAVKSHYNSNHGGGDFRVYRAEGEGGPTLVEVGHSNGDAYSALAVYKILPG